MSFRARLTLVAAAAVALAVVAASAVVYVVVRNELRSRVDNDLRSRAARASKWIESRMLAASIGMTQSSAVVFPATFRLAR